LVAQLALFGRGSHARDELTNAYGAGPGSGGRARDVMAFSLATIGSS
jgi:hypothetical protein